MSQTVDEEKRLRALDRYDVIDIPPMPDLTSIVELAAHLYGVPTAVVNIISADEQVQIAATGFEPGIVPRADSMCAVSIRDPEPVLVPDASRDPRFADNPFVTGVIDHVRFYASSQLRVDDGSVLGTLCVFDTQVHDDISAEQRAGLDKLARMVVDVLELRRHGVLLRDALRRVQATSEELHRSNAALAHFAGQVSHDLKNPLTGVLGFVATLADLPAVAEDPVARRCVDRSLSSATRMWKMIDNVLAHASAGGRPNHGTVDLYDIARQVVEDLQPAITAAGATVTVGRLPTVTGDATQLRVLLQNLVSNAVKFRVPGRPPLVRITGGPAPDGWTLSVADNGVGIPADRRADVLEMFTRLRPEVEGSGIGLATCQRVVAAHGATLHIDDNPGGGTVVSVDLPALSPATSPAPG